MKRISHSHTMKMAKTILGMTASIVMTGCGSLPSGNQVASYPSAASPPYRMPIQATSVTATAMPANTAPANAAPPISGGPNAAPMVSQVGFIGDIAADSCATCTAPNNVGVAGSMGCGCQACGPTAQIDGSQSCGMPAFPCPPGFDPQEYLCDGGDAHGDVFVRRDDTFGGLQAEDTVVHYTTEAGDIETNASNRVCVYAPRFASVRKITGAVAGGHSIGLATVDRPVGAGRIAINEGGVVIGETTELGHADVSRRIDAMRDRSRLVPVESVMQPVQNVDVLAILAGVKWNQLGQLRDEQKAVLERYAAAAIAWTIDESVEVAIEDLKAPTLTRDQTVEGLTVYDFPDAGRLQIVKLADRSDAKPGETVSFAIRVDNVGDSPVEQVTLTDNLTTRLEYVVDSQTCSGDAEFSAVANSAASMQLIWKLNGKLRVGESVTVRFDCKVR
ncbi:hypothetical protein K227x_13960 [Rubripirellula lacrimiformis]|uniref:DUF11 domain-containing protein n=1 Tax=Rubripirellula lacrimiformis TaxID=1930273 RepID=A0A517N788_9BACT|nr:DUF11 domain-containing protein [Rubripirellula lacrimiformis]QDT03017.1 hypothetical protein K227x_13960 [Rubripirellula lacrimiformis]